ncbi:MAG: hypothetical protein R3362_13020, partial [Rhodothermales bacterium]|nr:hypothetical protein [Rhodothermales bacterium]
AERVPDPNDRRANRVFITYKLEASQYGYTSNIQDLYFIYRPEVSEDVDVPILYLNAQEPAVQQVILNGGTRLAANEAAFEPFYDQLVFHQLDSDAAVVAVGNRVIRDPAEASAERQRLLATVRRFMY